MKLMRRRKQLVLILVSLISNPPCKNNAIYKKIIIIIKINGREKEREIAMARLVLAQTLKTKRNMVQKFNNSSVIL